MESQNIPQDNPRKEIPFCKIICRKSKLTADDTAERHASHLKGLLLLLKLISDKNSTRNDHCNPRYLRKKFKYGFK
jgi:hypothetical protein